MIRWIAHVLDLVVELNLLTPRPVYVVIGVVLDGWLVGLISDIRMYRYYLYDGMTVRL